MNNNKNEEALRQGCVAQITGLMGRTDLNGRDCRLLSWSNKAGRWAVELANENVLIKSENLLPQRDNQLTKHSVQRDALDGNLEQRAPIDLGGPTVLADATVSTNQNEPSLQPGCMARITGLVGRTDLNGRKCRLLYWIDEAERWAVKLTDEEVRIKSGNLFLLKNDQRKQRKMRPQDARARLDFLGKTTMTTMSTTVDDIIAEYSEIIDLLSSNRKLVKLYKRELSDAFCARSHHLLSLRKNKEAKDDAAEAIRHDPKNDGAYYNRAMSLINERDFVGAIEDLSMVLKLIKKEDVDCLVKRSYCHVKLEDFQSCADDMDVAQAASLRMAAVLPEFVSIHEHLASQNIILKKVPLAISDLTKAISVLPDELLPPLLIWRSHAYLIAGNASYFREDLHKARDLKFHGIEDRTLVDHLLSQEGKVGGGCRTYQYSQPISRPHGAIVGDIENLEGEHNRYHGQAPSERAKTILHTSKNAARYIYEDANERSREKIEEIATLVRGGSRFAEEVYHQSNGFESMIHIVSSHSALFGEKTLSLKILDVVATSGNRELSKILLRSEELIDSLLLMIKSCSRAVVAKAAPIHYCPSLRIPWMVPETQRTCVLAEQAGELLLNLSLCANLKVAQDLLKRDMVKIHEDMVDAYRNHWTDGVNQGEGFLIGSLECIILSAVDHVKTLCGDVQPSRVGITKKHLRDLTRAGQRCSNPDCPKTQSLSMCEERNEALHLCSRCKINMYCSEQCLKQHWSWHKIHCRKRRD